MSSFSQERYQQAVDALDGGDESAKTTIAFYKLTGYGGVTIDAEEAVALLRERVDDGDAQAMLLLGLCTEHGIGTEKDVELAKGLYSFSAEAGVPVAVLLLTNEKKGTDSFVINNWSLL